MNYGSRQPRAIITVNGVRMSWKSAEVNSNIYYQADTFRAVFPVSNQPSGVQRSWWASQTQFEVKIYTGPDVTKPDYTESDLDLLIVGGADVAQHDMVTNEIVLVGRDYTSRFIDNKTTMKWPNSTSSNIAKWLAERRDLNFVGQGTSTKVGIYYKHDKARMAMELTEWDLLTWLAGEEGFQVYVSGKDLHFEPIPDQPIVYPIMWTDATDTDPKRFNAARFNVNRNLSLAKDIIVYVSSWNSAKKQKFTKIAKSQHTRDKILKSINVNIGKPQVISKTIPGLTPEQALQKAREILREYSHHQITLSISGMPADNVLTPGHIIRLSGTGEYDQDYRPDSIIRSISIDHGYTMDITAKNHDVYSDVVL